MPNKPKRLCAYPGCGEVVESGYCEKHAKQKKKAKTKKRLTRKQLGYDENWLKVRNLYIKKHPLCEICKKENKVIPAEIVHHIVPIKKGGARLNFDNLMSVCNDCHEKLHVNDRFGRSKDERL